jgi:hypothetical protein
VLKHGQTRSQAGESGELLGLLNRLGIDKSVRCARQAEVAIAGFDGSADQSQTLVVVLDPFDQFYV